MEDYRNLEKKQIDDDFFSIYTIAYPGAFYQPAATINDTIVGGTLENQ